MRLTTDRLLLRELAATDEVAVHAYASDPQVVRYEDWGPNTPAETRAFLEQAILGAQADPRVEYTLAVVHRGSEALIGAVSLWIESAPHRRGGLGYTLHAGHWGRGYATEAARALLGFGFDALGLERIAATCDTHHGASARVLEKIGMQREGLLRRHMVTRDGRPRDTLLLAALRPA